MEVEGGSKRKQITKKRRDIDIEKANQLMKKSKNHSNKEAAESADKEVIVSNLEIVAWLVDHPEILRLALEMNNTDVAISSSSKITDDKIRLWDESVKCLFLRARSPRGEVFDELITKIFKIKIHSNEAKSYLEKTRKFFIDFRNKFNQIILTSVEEFKEIRKN
ncbi:3459_t:CDS:2, partial [Rhizophagus irregularis]